MKVLASFALASVFLLASPLFAEAIPGKAAPAFEVKDANGATRTLKEFDGKWIVLEWFNKDCPFVKKHYESANIQNLQKKYISAGTAKQAPVVWLTVNSSAEGKQGSESGSEALATAKRFGASPSAILLDKSGTMGKAYGAKTTPHIFIINPKQEVVYAGGIDNNDSKDPATIKDPKTVNYVANTLDLATAGKAVEPKTSRAYGCSVKYL